MIISGISLSAKTKSSNSKKEDEDGHYPIFATVIFTIGWMCLLIVMITSEDYKFIFDVRTYMILISVAVIIISFDVGGFAEKPGPLIVAYSIAYMMLGIAMSLEHSNLGRGFAFIGVMMILFSEFVNIFFS